MASHNAGVTSQSAELIGSKPLFPSTASKLDILILRQLILKTLSADRSSQTSVGDGGKCDFSRCTEALKKLDRVINTESLLDMLRPHEGLLTAPTTCYGCLSYRPFFEKFHPLAPDLAFVIQRLSAAFSPSPKNGYHEVTYHCLLNASIEDTPLLSPTTLSKLSRVTTLPFVTEEVITGILEDETFGLDRRHPRFDRIHALKSREVLDCIFYAKQGEERVKWTSADALVDVLNSMHTKSIERLRFGAKVADYQVEARRSVSSLLAFVVMMVIVGLMVADLGIWQLFELSSATSPGFSWSNYCEKGVESSCYFMQRSLSTLATHEDALRFVRVEVVNNLWGSVTDPSQSAADVPNGEAWYLGALLVRVAAVEHSGQDRFSSSFLNTTLDLSISTANEVFSAGALHYVMVPFSHTQEQALDALADFNVAAGTQDVSVVITYALLHPPTGAVIFNEAALVFKQAGNVVTRARHYIASSKLKTAVTVSFIVYNCFYVIEMFLVLLNAFRGFPCDVGLLSLFGRMMLVYLINVTFAMTNSYTNVEHWAQADFVPHNIDHISYINSMAQYSFGSWLLLLLASSSTYLSHIQVVRLVVDLVTEAAAPLVSTTIVMMCCFIGFVAVAMFIFGASQVEFSTFVYALRIMFPFLFGAGDSSVFYAELPVVGGFFYAIFAAATNFIALNIFNGVMMAPLGDLISSSGALMKKLCFSVAQRESRASHPNALTKQLRTLRMFSLPWVNFAFDAVPAPDMNWSVLSRFLDPKSPYHYIVNSARQLYEMQDYVSKQHADYVAKLPPSKRAHAKDWRRRSILYRSLKRDHDFFGMTDTSVTLMTLLVMYECRWDLFRDARLAKIVGLWEAEKAHLEKDFSSMEGWEPISLEEDDDKGDVEESNAESAAAAAESSLKAAALASADKATTRPPPLQLALSSSLPTAAAAVSDDDESAAKSPKVSPPQSPTSPGGKSSSKVPSKLAVDLRDESSSSDEDDAASNNKVQAANGLSPIQELKSFTNFNAVARTQTEDAESQAFYFTELVERRLLGSYAASPMMTLLLQTLHVLCVLAGYVALIVVIATWTSDGAYFTEDLHSGLRDGLYRESCNDPLCASATTTPISFAQAGSYQDLQNFLSLVVQPQIFDFVPKENGSSTSYLANESLPLSGHQTTPVRWSSAVRFHSLKIRQLRALEAPCSPLVLSTPNNMNAREAKRYATLTSTPCYSNTEFSTEPLCGARGGATPCSPVLPPSAYEFQSTCPDAWKSTTAGFQYSYPCAGYTATINSTAQLQYASSTWLNDPSVRLIVLSFLFYHNDTTSGGELRVTYDMYVELGMGGEQCEFWVSTTPRTTDTTNIAAHLIYMIHIHGSITSTCFTYWLILYRGNVYQTYRQASSQFPIMSTLLSIAAIAFYYSEYPTVQWAGVSACCFATLLFTVKAIAIVIIPATGLISRRATTFPRMSVYIGGRLLIVGPFFLIFWIAFALSGYVMWGTSVQEYATIGQAFKTVGLGMIGSWDFASINAVFPGLAIAVTALFFIVVTVVLLPTLLSLIVQSAEDANDELATTNEVMALAKKNESRVLFGPMATFLLAVWVSGHKMNDPSSAPCGHRVEKFLRRIWLRVVTKILGYSISRATAQQQYGADDDDDDALLYSRFSDAASGVDDASRMLDKRQNLRLYEAWRLPLAVECLNPFMGAPRAQHLLKLLQFHKLNATMQYTAIAFLIKEMTEFRQKDQVAYEQDLELEKAVMLRGAKAAVEAAKHL